MVENI